MRCNYHSFCSKLTVICTAAVRKLRLANKAVQKTAEQTFIFKYVLKKISSSYNECDGRLFCVFSLLYLKALVSHNNEYSQDHTNYVFSQVILCSMCTAWEYVSKEAEMKTNTRERGGRTEAGAGRRHAGNKPS